jgi:hypothetical protein
MTGIEPSLNLAAETGVSDRMDAVEVACNAWKLDKANPETIELFHMAAYRLWSYLGGLKTVAGE